VITIIGTQKRIMNDNSNRPPNSETIGTTGPSRLVPVDVHRDSTGSGPTGSETTRASGGNDPWEGRASPSPNGNSNRGRPTSGIPGQRPVDPAQTLLQAFEHGDPEVVYQAALDLKVAYKEAMLEGAKLRFKLNFGTPFCEECDGLRAGPGVIATCFQIKRCDYTSLKDGNQDPDQVRLITSLVTNLQKYEGKHDK